MQLLRGILQIGLSIQLSLTLWAGQAPDDLSRGRNALTSGNISEAIGFLEAYRRDNPTHAEVYNLLGIAYGRANDDPHSLAMFKEYARLEPNRPEAYNNLGATYLREGDGKQGEDAFRQALRLNPDDLNALYNLGALLNARRGYSESLPLLERALQQERAPAIAYEAAVASAGSGDRKTALQMLNSVTPPTGPNALPWLKLSGTLNLDAGHLSAASKDLEKAAALKPDEETLYALSVVRLKTKEPERALTLLDQLFKDLPTSARHLREGTLLATYEANRQALLLFEKAALEDPSSYDAYFNLAVLRLDKSKDLNGALEAARQAVGLRPTGEIHALLGDIYEAKSLFREALNEFQEAVRLDPSNDKLLFDLGAELLLHENYDAAEQIFQSGEERFPKASRIYLGLGATEFMKGKHAEAVASFLKAVDLDPEFEPAYIFLGEAGTFSTTQSGEVVAKLAKMAATRPQSFGIQYYYGACLVQEMAEEQNHESVVNAQRALQKATLLNPGDARVPYQLGETYRIEQHYQEAASYYQKSAALDPNFPEPLYKMGQAYLRLGEQEKAKRMFARHREVLAKVEAGLYHRSSEIQTFVLKPKASQ